MLLTTIKKYVPTGYVHLYIDNINVTHLSGVKYNMCD